MHGITFALLHLACMRMLAVGVGAASALLTMLSGVLYARMEAAARAHECIVPGGLAGRPQPSSGNQLSNMRACGTG
jgi:hypothetical protein